MAFCSNCGTESQGRFCAKCGSPLAAPPAAAAGVNVAPPPPPPPPPPAYTAPPQNYGAQQSYQQPPPPNYGAQQQAYQQPAPVAVQGAGLTDNMAAALCYVLGLLTGVLFLVLAPYNQNRLIRFHAFQSIFMHLAMIAAMIALMMLTGILHLIPFVGAMLSFVLYPIVGFGFFCVWLVLMYKAYNNERWVLPIIGPLAEKQA